VTSDLVAVPRHVCIGGPWAGLTAFAAVRRAFPEVEPREVFKKARCGQVLRNDRRCDPLEPLADGDVVTVVLLRPRQHPKAVASRRDLEVDTPAGPFRVVWEDNHLLAAGKPPGCASHPGLKRSGNTLLDRVRAHLGVARADPFQPALANRLDIGTSGIVLIGKTRAAQRRLGRQLQKGLVQKSYLALVRGRPDPPDGAIREALAKRPDSRDRRRLPPDHPRLQEPLQAAETRYRTLAAVERPEGAALLELELITGRTHQIRRHLAGKGVGVAGDGLYGEPGFNAALGAATGLARMFLHAWRVRLPHPHSGEPLEFTAPLPADLALCLQSLGIPQPETRPAGEDAPAVVPSAANQ